jgi:hypothetical protein
MSEETNIECSDTNVTNTTNEIDETKQKDNLEETDETVHYSMVKKELLLENDLILEEQYKKARDLMEKIKLDKINEITKEEEGKL